ncbi:ARM repeat-containing protein [Gonapodya prolifera JEL478]|uniref:ARM repeat-containing protein n=1 Tax=Gonapodya prolifera (strain JEL478) TaxID=1344416 RepID=A0A139AZE3_GONPJ|nr:ARM repeat-containing protein [Gonapodya prolifera JEL478]|eukprot:KXS22101.1 ARM repeat-containing protein [Gonapodya prolifera JEL478]
MAWQPQPDGLQQLSRLLADSTALNKEVRERAQQQLDAFNQIPDYNNYLIYILTQLTTENPSTRAIAGLLVKNNIRNHWDRISAASLEYVKTCVVVGLADPQNTIRSTTGTIITTVISKGGIQSWPSILGQLIQLLNHPDANVIEGAFGALQKVCEDNAKQLDSDEAGRPLNYMIPRFMEFFGHQNPKIRVFAISCVNQFILPRSQALMTVLPQFVQALYSRANDENEEVRKQICQALVMLLEVRPDQLMPQLDSVVQFMLYCTQDKDEGVALEACEFWLAFAEQDEMRDKLEPYLDRIIPVLLKGMVYSDEDVVLYQGEDDDAEVPDQDQDIKPTFAKSRTHTQKHVDGQQQQQQSQAHGHSGDASAEEGDEEEIDEDEDDEDVFQEWNLRKCSAAALDVLATVYGDDILKILLPELQSRLSSEDWLQRECGVLALGAVAEGCITGMEPHLPQLVPALLAYLSDRKPLVRSITCWTLGRYARWIVAGNPPNHIPQEESDRLLAEHQKIYFEPTMIELLKMMLDNNKRVQEAGCSAFATLEEEGGGDLAPYLPHILQTFYTAFGKYQHKNLLILYDAVGTLADSVGNALNNQQYVSLLMNPLVDKWQNLKDQSRDMFPLLECLSSVAMALGPGFAPFAPSVWNRCLQLISVTLQQIQASIGNPGTVEQPDKDFIIVALDLLSGIVQGLGSNVDGLLQHSQPPLLTLLGEAMRDPVGEVRQSAYALLGDLAINVFPHIRAYVPQFMPDVIEQIEPSGDSARVSVCNNAAWAAGEIALQYGPEISVYVEPLLRRLIPILRDESNPRTLLENAAITIGRLGLVCPDLVAPHLETFAEPWCKSLRSIRDNPEKESAFQGLCAMIQKNPNGIVKSFVYFCDAVTQWKVVNVPLNQQFSGIIHAFKNMMGPQWDNYFREFPQHVQQRLRTRYQI